MQELKNNSTYKRLYSISELVASIGATEWFWRNQIWSGRLPVVRVGTKQLVDHHDIEKFISDHKSTSPSTQSAHLRGLSRPKT